MKKFFLLTIIVSIFVFSSTINANAVDSLSAVEKSPIKSVLDVQSKSYAPYSNFNVAATVLCDSGKIYTNVNIENASFPVRVCADYVNSNFCSPCGVYRQYMREFANPKEMKVILAKNDNEYIEKTLEELLLLSFDPGSF